MQKAILFLILFLNFSWLVAQDIQRFPRPEFKTGYEQPQLKQPSPRSWIWEYLDLLVLLGALSTTTLLVHKKRSRLGIFSVVLFSLTYFGFWREGCICSVGSLQNLTLALFDSSYAVPLTVIGFFFLPLVFALIFGRTFCAAVCPLGAIQEVVILYPLKVPGWLVNVLSLVPYFYLGLAILFAATGSAFIICELDPFVGLFRLTADVDMLLLGACFLVLGIFVARPYCRFLCPYGVLLSWLSKLSKWHVTITPAECIQCRLCENSCPFSAIDQPTADVRLRESSNRGIRRLGIFIMLLPLLIVGSGWIGSKLHQPFAKMHRTVRLAEQIRLEDTGKVDFSTKETEAFRGSGKLVDDLYREAIVIQKQFETGSWLFGCFIGLVIGLKLIALSIRRKRTDYQPDKGACLSCARCFAYCPIDKGHAIWNF